ncbi:glycosyltransferase family 2 protein [Klebsiella pneumoniae]|uniref:glycosyltransferase family 2 protein n=1 Tax=Klebsiella pneumoniae complex TaxID=3390273 RepID=UPI001914EA0D|nr:MULTISPECIES: glycosyltransferase family 2 protein [Klebsiella]MBQ5019337.1 glycosyltransferase family 2 protein [Klebsiella pneumoniae]MBQ5041840.1 glycosyltransferase family 2 protein [Klebsiella pneumoniae]MDZ1838122.1 glycosyltransferase family 2 protein [Klebsiella pneumoniae]MDZ1970712.1 glycosyltransferase family 2 protein [Klebsiella pneumoniae]QQM79837.1 glycosyltransferase family 2 protein [Klebsiella quasipneumoniae]
MTNEFIVSAIIVTYNPEITILNSLIASLSVQADNVIIVDNASKNISEMHFSDPKVKLIPNEHNVGLARAQNIGVEEIYEATTHFLFFDQDSEIDDDFVLNQLKCASELINNGINFSAIGPVFYDRKTGYKYPATIYKGLFKKRQYIGNVPLECTFIISSGSLIRKQTFIDVGLMLDDFFIDFIDVEWCLRAKSKGYGCYLNPYAQMVHSMGDQQIEILGKVISLHSDFRKNYIFRNGMYIFRLPYIPFSYKLTVLTYNLVRTILGIAYSKNKYITTKKTIRGWALGFGKFNSNARFLKIKK